MSEISTRALFKKYLNVEDREKAKEAILMAECRDYLVDRVLGSVRGMKDGKYKDCEQDLIENIVDGLLLSGVIKTEKVKKIPLTQINRERSYEKRHDWWKELTEDL